MGRGARRPTPLIRRALARPVAGRVLAGLVLVALAAALYGMTASPAFRLRENGVVVVGADFTARRPSSRPSASMGTPDETSSRSTRRGWLPTC